MDTIDNNEAPKRRIEDFTPDATLDWTKPDAPAVPVASAPARIVPLRAVASMSVHANGVSVFPTPAAETLPAGHYMLSAPGAGQSQDAIAEQGYAETYNGLLTLAKNRGFDSIGDAIRAGAAAKAAASVSAPIASTPELQQLKALALAATPGPWKFEIDGTCSGAWPHINTEAVDEFGEPYTIAELPTSHVETEAARAGGGMPSTYAEDASRFELVEDSPSLANAAYIAAASPAVVLDLIARIERAAAPAPAEAQGLAKQFGYPAIAPAASGDELPDVETLLYDHARAVEHVQEYGDTGGFYNARIDAENAIRAAVSAATKPTADLSSLERMRETSMGLEVHSKGDLCWFADVQSLLATKPAAAPAESVAWMRESDKECISAADKKKMEGCEFGQWATIAKRYTIPLYASPMASADAVIEAMREYVLPGYSASSGEGGGVRPDPEGEYVLRSEAIEAAKSVFAAQPTMKGAGE